MRNLARKMVGYALGRSVTASDQRLMNEMAEAGSGASFADLAMKIVTSRQFRNHEGRGAAAPTTNPASPIRAAAMASPTSPEPGATQ